MSSWTPKSLGTPSSTRRSPHSPRRPQTLTRSSDESSAERAFCYECMKYGHHPRGCPIVEAKESERLRRIQAIPANQRPPEDPNALPQLSARKQPKPRKVVMPVEVPDGPKQAEIMRGDMFFEKMLNNAAMFRAVYSADVDGIMRHVKRGADISDFDSTGLTALHVASMHGYSHCISALLSLRADPNIMEKHHQRTPIMLAGMFGHSHCVKILLLAGADPTKPCDSGENALDRCKNPVLRYMMEEYWKTKSMPDH
eukprot:TRINITY_DN2621_c0_g1_i6.p1 TRINITY_DN2621_c0_g1~~TRINITY_DN2621_c0_g1_i6.p1  ORF type:complete len:255 (+),score=39.87 TRINITY_DN2621_c0_g1_i6:71-835(+)